jgi:hypothetical protein
LQTNLECLSKEYNICQTRKGNFQSLEDLQRRQSLWGFLLFERVKISKPRTNDDTSNANQVEVGLLKKFKLTKFLPEILYPIVYKCSKTDIIAKTY